MTGAQFVAGGHHAPMRYVHECILPMHSRDGAINQYTKTAKPEIITNERNKKADAESKIEIIKESLGTLEL